MSRPALSRRGAAVLATVGWVALAIVALAHASAGWTCAVVTVTAIAPLLTLVGAIFGERAIRPFCGGVSICCGGFFTLYFFFARAISYQTSGPASPCSIGTLATTQNIPNLHDPV